MKAARVVSEKAAELGLTTIHDIFLSSDEIRGYQDAYRHGSLKIRVQMSPQIDSLADSERLAHMGVHTGFPPGKLADFIVVDRDVLSVPAEELKDVKVLGTYVGGQPIVGAKKGLD